MPRLFTSVVLLASSLSASAALAQPQPAAPKPPDKFKALIRYRILAPRDVHVAMYDALIADLKKLDFEFIPPLGARPRTDREDPSKDRIAGLVPSSKALLILRNPHVAGLILLPEKLELPDDAD